MIYHQPVLLNQIIDFILNSRLKTIIDTTLGNGGHTISFLKNDAAVYAIDLDKNNLKIASQRIKELKLNSRFYPINGNFADIKNIHSDKIKKPIDLIFFDLGLSLNQQKSQNRGFSFEDNLSLDMRIDPDNQSETAKDIINSYSQSDLFQIFSKYGQERYSQEIANLIVNRRKQYPFNNANDLASCIKDFFQKNNLQRTKIHPATKIFLALKIYVNQEITNLKKALEDSLSILKKNGWLAIITFHSTEDRIVKNFIKQKLSTNHIYNVKKIRPDYSEIKNNPLSRSAILRLFQVK